MKSAARITLKFFSIMGIIASLIYATVWAIFFRGFLNGPIEVQIAYLLPIIASAIIFLFAFLSLIALKVDRKGFMIGVGVLGCLFVVGFGYSIILFSIAHYEYNYYYDY